MKPWKIVAGTALLALVACGCHDETPRSGGSASLQGAVHYQEAPRYALTREVVVTDPFGWPISGARVGLWILDGGTSAQAYTLAEGTVVFTFTSTPDRVFYLNVQAPGFLPVAMEDIAGVDPHQIYYVTLFCD